MTTAMTEILEKLACLLPVDIATDAAIWAHIQQQRATTPQLMLVVMEASSRQSDASSTKKRSLHAQLARRGTANPNAETK